LGASLALAATSTPPEWHPTQEIIAVAENYLLDRLGSSSDQTTVQAGRLDERHRLARCSKALQPYLRPGTEIKSRTIVGVRCSGAKPWKVYLPVNVVTTATVLVTTRGLPRGHRVTADDVRAQPRDVSRLMSGYMTDFEQLDGQQLKTQVLAGMVLTPAMLKATLAIRRGQSVTLIIGAGSINIRSRGIALMDGAIKQRIRVENTQSGRIVEGIVRSGEDVEVLLPNRHHFSNATPKVTSSLADTRSSNNDR
jgi:flagella basal body P-ring formation protein FlgA